MRTRRRRSRIWDLAVIAALLGGAVLVAREVKAYRATRAVVDGRAELARQQKLARAEGIPLTAAEFAAQIAPPPGENAAPLYHAAATLYLKIAHGDPNGHLFNPFKFEDPKVEKANRELLAKEKPAVEAVEKAARLQRCDMLVDLSKMDIEFGRFSELKMLAKLVAGEAELEARDGHPDQGLKTLAACAPMCAHIGQTHTMIATLVEAAVEAILVREVQSILGRFGPEPGVAAAARDAVGALGPPPDLIRMAEAENLLMMAGLSEDITKGPEPKVEGDEEERALATVLIIGRKPGVLDRWRAVQIEAGRRYVELFRQPIVSWIDLEGKSIALDRALLEPNDDAHAWRIFIGGDTWPAALDTIGLRISARRVLLQAAAEFERGKPGAWTPTLPVAGEAGQDPLGKGDYRYSADAKGFKVYGCGPHGVDHGGRPRGDRSGTMEYDVVFSYPPKA